MSKHCDDSRWPIVVMSIDSDRTLQDSIFFTEKFDEVLARKTPFALITIYEIVGEEKSNPEAANS